MRSEPVYCGHGVVVIQIEKVNVQTSELGALQKTRDFLQINASCPPSHILFIYEICMGVILSYPLHETTLSEDDVPDPVLVSEVIMHNIEQPIVMSNLVE